MYLNDLLDELEKALCLEPGSYVEVSERETRVLAEIAKMKAERPKRQPAADETKLSEVTRDVTRDMLYREPARLVAERYGISQDQARRISAQEIQRACRAALGRRTGKVTQEVKTLDWVVSATKDGVLGRARANVGLVHAALEEHWRLLDERAKERQV